MEIIKAHLSPVFRVPLFSDLIAYRPQKNGTLNTGLKWALIISIVLIIIAFCAAIAILFPYLKILGL